MSFGVLFVCTGNVCRSPAAELLLSAALPTDCAITVTSAGLAALVDHPLDAGVATALAARGLPAVEHRGRQYTPGMTLRADLVLTATQAQSAAVLREVPQALRKVFTLREFARLAAAAPGPRAASPETVAAVAGMRGRVAPVPDGADDIADPYRRGDGAAARSVAEVAAAVRGVGEALGVIRRRPLPYRR